uniref:Uncharacterized protein n=1 Tax=Globisporangium ultimum (strain ATCC 200006 / CBS 805.95 / DAOM BR144) TaxID=431595 RepID=K3WXR6_GLOUD
MTTTPANQSASAGSAPAHRDARGHAASIAVRTAPNGLPQPAQSATAVALTLDPQTDDEAAMLDILDMDLEMNIPDVKSSVAAWTQSNQYEAPLLARDLPTPTADAHAMKSQTCVTFLHIMKEFSESSCNAKEMVQRVDSLVHQDEQLLKLLPLTQEEAQAATPRRNRSHAMTTSETENATTSSSNHALLHAEATKHDRTGMPRSECNSSLKNKSSNNSNAHAAGPESDAMDVDVDGGFALVLGVDPMLRRITSPRSVDLQRPAGDLKPTSETQMMDIDDDDDGAKRAAKRQRDNDKEMDAHDELQRWIDLDLELDHRMDVFDFTKDHSPPELAPSATHSTSLPAQSSVSPFFKHANSAFLSSYANTYSSSATSKSAMEAAGYLRGYASAASRDMAPKKSFLGSPWHKVTPFDKKSVTAALFGDDDGDDDDDDSNVIDTMARAKLVANASQGAAARGAVAAAAERQRAGETKCDDESNVWGMEDDEYQQDLLSSIDHSVLCDRENRFLQWDLEMEAQQQQQQQMSTPPSSSSFGKSFSSSSTAVGGDRASKYKWMMATSPREKMARSPSNVDIVDDWNSLDFGTFQNRTVSHILSSCLNKRKLHHPYKNQVKLVNFNVSGDATVEPRVPSQHVLGGSLATSLAFGGQEDAIMNGETMGVGSTPLALLANKDGMALGKAANLLKGEKKSKKREERKRLMSLKMQETFADLEGTFTEQDLDFKGVVGAGSLSKMALAKLETMPLPDLSNLPQDLKDLKRKIEATEHKVEGTKHRHRKGGPCPRCQVQNQLRAAKRAYHKRAVAHKKLPQSAGSSTASSMSMLDAEAADMMFSSPPLTPTASPSSVFDGSSPSLSPVSTTSSASPVSSAMRTAGAGAPFLPVVLPASIASSAPAKQTPASTLTFSSTTTLSSSSSSGPSSLMVAVGSSSNAATHALLQHRQQSAAVQLAKTASRSIAASMGNNALQGGAAANGNAARSAAAFQATSARRPCGNTFASSSSSATSATSSSSSSPESTSPQVQQVTVTSA